MTKYITPVLVLAIAILAVALFVRGGEVITALIINTTNTTTVSVAVLNIAPLCENMVCYDFPGDNAATIALAGGDKKYVKCNTTCNDNNGWGDVQNYTGQINNIRQAECAASNLWCYTNSTCQNTSAKNSSAQFVTCTFPFWYNAANTSSSGTWHGMIMAGDVGGLVGNGTDDINVSTLLALGVDSLLAFGSKSAAVNDSLQTYLLQLYNYGNTEMDFQVNASAMTCSQGSVPPGYLHVNLSYGQWYNQSYPLNITLCGYEPGASCGKFSRFNLTANSTPTTEVPNPPNKTTYWGIGVPAGVNGNCQGTIWFAAVES